jgi:hypothetical protein
MAMISMWRYILYVTSDNSHIRKSCSVPNIFCEAKHTYLQATGSTKILALVLVALLVVMGTSDGAQNDEHK